MNSATVFSASATASSSESFTITRSNCGAWAISCSALATRFSIVSAESVPRPAPQLLDRRRHDEDGQGACAERFLEIDASLDVHVENDYAPLLPYPVHFAAQRAVAGSGIDLLPFDELPCPRARFELVVTEEIVLASVNFLSSRRPARARYGKFEAGKFFEQAADDRGLSRSGRSRENDDFSFGDSGHGCYRV